MITAELVVALVAVLRPVDASRLVARITGAGASDVARQAIALAAQTRVERATALATALRRAAGEER